MMSEYDKLSFFYQFNIWGKTDTFQVVAYVL